MAVKSKSALAAHTAGIFADMTLDGPEIGTLVAVVDRAKNLPNRKTMGKQDPYCAMRLGKEAKKTETDRRGGQTPKWDQELRFTVHDSPDYYKLKISVFNDDKRTDLIGEAFIDLRDLIKPGGGSNDLWHQLNYKGKYAGDIRMEMTYYDIRPREEKVGDKRRTKDKSSSVTSGSTSTVSGPRVLGGPREVRRRPLPASPAGTTPAPSTLQDLVPQVPPKIPMTTTDSEFDLPIEVHVGSELYDNHYSISPVPYETEYSKAPLPDYNHSGHYRIENGPHMYIESDLPHHDISCEKFRTSTSSLPNPSLQQHSYPSEAEEWDGPQRRHSDYILPADNHIAQTRLPPPLLHHPNSAPEVLQYRTQSHSGSPTKTVQFRDSPLRYSMNQYEDTDGLIDTPTEDEAPPPPPKHRESLPRKSQPEYPPSAYAPKPLRPTSRRSSVDDRSPLQNIEHQYSPYNTTPLQTPPRQHSYNSQEQTSYETLHSSSRRNSGEAYSTSFAPLSTPERHSSHDVSYDHNSMVLHRPEPMSDNNGYYGRHSSGHTFAPQPDETSQTADGHFRAQSGYQPEGGFSSSTSPYAESPYTGSQPQTIAASSATPSRVRPQNAGMQIPTRKAISPSPYPEQSNSRLHGMPFGPDSYDVLNPASSPATNENTPFETPEQSKEAARLREVERLRDQGPIIGNDGRVIDPSDHLPSDTWAPEPERKQRKPEHVIHVRTRNDMRAQTTPNSSPASIRMNMHKGQVTSSSSPSSPMSTPPSSSRNRLQKHNPNRPLPVQPLQHQRPLSSHNSSSNQQAHHRNSYHDISPGIERPSLSEYQVNVNVNGSNSSQGQELSAGMGYQHQPPRMPYVEDYPSNGYDDPLTAEMRMIDIGPSRGGRSMARSGRGY